MEITQTHIKHLLSLLKRGLIHGAGRTVNEFCVQQAVNRVLHDDLNNPEWGDHPSILCISELIRQFGIRLNDQDGWNSDHDRAEGLKRFAIAELGSAKIDSYVFFDELAGKLGTISARGFSTRDYSIIGEFMAAGPDSMSKNDKLTTLANAAAEVLKEMETEGSKFLYLVDEPDKKKQAHEARKLGNQIFAVQLAEEKHRWGTDSDFGLPVKGHHHHFKK